MIFHSPYPAIEIPDTALTPFVLRHASRLADKPAMIDGLTGCTLSYGQLVDAILSAAAGLVDRGLRKGDVFAIYAPNCLEYAVAFHAVASLGGITTTVNPLFTADELTHQLIDAGATYLLTIPALLEKAGEAARRAGVREVFVIGEAPDATPFASLSIFLPAMSHSSLSIRAPIWPRSPFRAARRGYQKVSCSPTRTSWRMSPRSPACEPVSEADTLIGVLPFFHIYGLTVLMNFGLAAGATIVMLPRFELGTFLQTLETYRRDLRLCRSAGRPGSGETADG